MKKRFLRMATLAAAVVLSVANAAAQPQSPAPSGGSWQFSITPYLWLPNVNGTLKFDTPPGAGGRPAVETGPNDYLENLELALMLSGEARKGAWAIFTDVIYLDFSNETAAVKSVSGPSGMVQVPVNTNTRTGLEGMVWELAASYAVSRTDAATFEVLGGFRYVALKASVNWELTGALGLFPQSGSFSQEEELWDAIAGVRGKWRPGGGNWFAPYYLDAGAGSSQLTWQAMAGVGYSFKWGDLLLAYRHLSYEQEDGKLVEDLRFSGAVLGAAFRF